MSSPRRKPVERERRLAVVEALVFAADGPLTVAEMLEVLPGSDEPEILRLLGELQESLQGPGRGLQLEKVAGGWRFATRGEVGEWVRRLYRFRNRRRLSPAALETLAIVAYRQPITAPEIQQLRGVDPQAALHGLLERRLVKILGRKKVVGRPLVYGTTTEFLMHFGLDSTEDLPSLDVFGELLDEEARRRLAEAGLAEAGPAASPGEVEPLEAEESGTGSAGIPADEDEVTGEPAPGRMRASGRDKDRAGASGGD